MSLLELERVVKRYSNGSRESVVLDQATFSLERGELVVIWGQRRSGRSTLLRVAAGVERPDAGLVRFEGHDLAEHGEQVLGGGIGYCQRTLRSNEGHGVLDHVAVGLLARGIAPGESKACARDALARTGAESCIGLPLGELDSAEIVRVGLARALAPQPRLLIIDEPTKGVDMLERDAILLLLRSLADDGIAVLASAGESTALSGADRALALSEGQLRGAASPDLAPVVPLRPAVGQAASG